MSSFKPAVSGADLYLVQCRGTVRPEWETALAQTGAAVLAYVPDNAYLVRATVATMLAIGRLSFVRWTGYDQPAFRVDPTLLGSKGTLDLLLSFWPDPSVPTRVVKVAGVRVVSASSDEVEVIAPAGALTALADLPDLSWIEATQPPVAMNNEARSITYTNVTEQDLGLYGAGQVVAIANSGLNVGGSGTLSADFGPMGQLPKVKAAFTETGESDWSDADGHGTHVASTLAGEGVLSARIRRSMTTRARLPASRPRRSW